MSSPKYSIVIPTRERAQTLHSCLQTCLNIDYSNYEIIVGDNHSSEETYKVVKQFGSSKIKYYRTDRPLSMSKNWELALDHAAGEWVGYIGDDDCVLPHIFEQMDRILSQISVKTVRWDAGEYVWPTSDMPTVSNYLKVPISRNIEIHDAHEVIRQVLDFQLFIGYMPGFYHGFVHRSLINEIRQVSKSVFVGWYPDHFPGYACSYLGKQYARVGCPLTLSGHCPKSNGGTALRKNRPTDEFIPLNVEDNLANHPWIPRSLCDPVTSVYDPFLLAKEYFFPTDDRFAVDRKSILKKFGEWYTNYQIEDWEKAKNALRANLCDQPALLTWFDDFAGKLVPRSVVASVKNSHAPSSLKSRGVADGYLHLDAHEFGITDTVGAAALIDKLLCLRLNPVDFAESTIAPTGRLDRISATMIRSIRKVLTALGKKS